MDTPHFIVTKDWLESLKQLNITTRTMIPMLTPNPHSFYFRYTAKCECCGFTIGQVLVRDFGEYALMLWDKQCEADITVTTPCDWQLVSDDALPDDGAIIADLPCKNTLPFLTPYHSFAGGPTIFETPTCAGWLNSRFEVWQNYLKDCNSVSKEFALSECERGLNVLRNMHMDNLTLRSNKYAVIITCGDIEGPGCGARFIITNSSGFKHGDLSDPNLA